MSDSYHKSNLGAFGDNLPTDQDGYVHLTAEGWANAPMDWGSDEISDSDSDDERDRKLKYQREECERMAAEARAATVAEAIRLLHDLQATALATAIAELDDLLDAANQACWTRRIRRPANGRPTTLN